jgi:endonuclease YncB( thermonuclease family)
VRLLQIDAPELGTAECYSRKSTKELRRLLPQGAAIKLVADARLDRVDRYGRLLRYVIRGSTNVNVVMAARGAATVWFYGGDRGRYAGALLRVPSVRWRRRRPRLRVSGQMATAGSVHGTPAGLKAR